MNPNLIIKAAVMIGLGTAFFSMPLLTAGIEKINNLQVKAETAIEVIFERIE